MARPTKQGLEYFPLDVDFFQDPKVVFVEGMLGPIGRTILLDILSALYRVGYCYKWNDREEVIFATTYRHDRDDVIATVRAALEADFFDRDLLEREGVLSSRRIQETWFEASRKRKGSYIRKNRLLCEKVPSWIEIRDEKSFRGENPSPTIVSGTGNPSTTGVSAEITPQSKVKESKVNTLSKEPETKIDSGTGNPPEFIFEGKKLKLTRTEAEALKIAGHFRDDVHILEECHKLDIWLRKRGIENHDSEAMLADWARRGAEFAARDRNLETGRTRNSGTSRKRNTDQDWEDFFNSSQTKPFFTGETIEPD